MILNILLALIAAVVIVAVLSLFKEASSIRQSTDASGLNSQEPQIVIPIDAVEFQGHHYKVFEEYLTWKKANEACEAMGGQLAIVETRKESEFLSELTDLAQRAWIGGRDDHEEGNWIWTNGDPITFFDWTKENPSNKPNEDFLVMVGVSTAMGRDGRWNDAQNSFHLIGGFICEWE